MKTIGIVGGIGPESTIDYYRRIINLYRHKTGDGSYPPVVINSIDMKKMLDFVVENRLAELTRYLVQQIRKLAAAGAQVGLLASNTPHVVFDRVRRKSPIPLVSIVEATRAEATALGFKRLGLFGTRFTMQGRFYPDVFTRGGISLVLPEEGEQAYIHEKYMNELVAGVFSAETRRQLMRFVNRMKKQENIDGLILGGTELPLIFQDVVRSPVPFLDTAQIHVKHIMAQALSN